ncbi:DUF805 domain-containing protein [Ancylobacter radicis]|uniref:DUF805 domain-containing protein n=1 Tax=Ancylobacter radicis TaxID=2836179 RepID=A0ABS5RBZ7_9HYPH|nr:DUF805 domain-containing protein [Ancylobacter radicis]MBS9478622.1 DUF805 domain-containing protein [Ancylobacter radicis]
MTFTQAISSVLGQYASFTGRAPRSEYWWWVLFSVLVNIATSVLDTALFGAVSLLAYGEINAFTPISTLVGLALLIPSIAVAARRFHDLDRSGWWLLIGLTGIGALVIFFWFMVRGTRGPNRFGHDILS